MIQLGTEAKLYYGDGNYDIMQGGDHVRCGVTGQKIMLSQLRYWSVDAQQAYASAEIAVAAITDTDTSGEE